MEWMEHEFYHVFILLLRRRRRHGRRRLCGFGVCVLACVRACVRASTYIYNDNWQWLIFVVASPHRKKLPKPMLCCRTGSSRCHYVKRSVVAKKNDVMCSRTGRRLLGTWRKRTRSSSRRSSLVNSSKL